MMIAIYDASSVWVHQGQILLASRLHEGLVEPWEVCRCHPIR
jgi:hypothetical protein